MKLRGQLNLLLLLMAVIPGLTTAVFVWQVNDLIGNQSDVSMQTFATATNISQSLNASSELFLDGEELISFVQDQEEEGVEITLYGKDRTLIYDSEQTREEWENLSPKEMMRDLYKLSSVGNTQVYKEPIFHGDEIVGFVELRFPQSTVKEATMEVYLLAGAFFVVMVMVTLFFVQYWFKKNMLRPFSLMQQEMREIGFGKQAVAAVPKQRARTEVAQLMHDFAKMSAKLKLTAEQEKRDAANQRRFIAAISHDLRTPLTSIRAYAEGMLAHVDRREAYSEVILSKATNMQRLVDDLLLYSHIQSTSFSLSEKLVDGEELVELLLDGYDEQWPEFMIETKLTVQPCELYADVDRLIQVVDNLLTNAVRYSPKGGKITLCATNVRNELPDFLAKEEEGLYVFVEDEGKGIPLEAQKHLFDSFYQVEKSRQQTSSSGIGLGLAICKELIAQHGGEIGVRSIVAKKSTFYFRLPCTFLETCGNMSSPE